MCLIKHFKCTSGTLAMMSIVKLRLKVETFRITAWHWQLFLLLKQWIPSSIYSWSIDHILEHEFFCLGRLGSQGSKEKKSGFEFL